MAKIKILKLCATETQTYFGGELVNVPADVGEDLAKIWIDDGVAEPVEKAEAAEIANEAETPAKPAKKTKAK